MPDRDPEPQQSARLLTGLIWGGLGLAPIAALVALLGGSQTALRFAVLLVAVAVVLLGAALLVRNDPVVLKLDAEDRLAAGAGTLRDEIREEVAAAARATSHRVQALQDEMTRMRAAGSPVNSLPPPGLASGGVARAGVPQPGVAAAGVARPGMPQPGGTTAGVGSAGLAATGVAGPGMPQPGRGSAGVARPGMPQPGVAQPGRASAGVARPGLPESGMPRPGMAAADGAGIDMPAFVLDPSDEAWPESTDFDPVPTDLDGSGMPQTGMAPARRGSTGVVRSGMAQPGGSSGAVARRGMPEPGSASAEVARTGTLAPGVAQAGRASAGVARPGTPPHGRTPTGPARPGSPLPGPASTALPGAGSDPAGPEDPGVVPRQQGRAAVASAAVVPPQGRPFGPSAAGTPSARAATGSAAVAAAAVPHQRGAAAVPPSGLGAYPGEDYTGSYAGENYAAVNEGGGEDYASTAYSGESYDVQAYSGDQGNDAGALGHIGSRTAGSYGPGLSGSAWAERGADEQVPEPVEPRPSRRHAAPDTGTDIARYGLSAADATPYGNPASPGSLRYGDQLSPYGDQSSPYSDQSSPYGGGPSDSDASPYGGYHQPDHSDWPESGSYGYPVDGVLSGDISTYGDDDFGGASGFFAPENYPDAPQPAGNHYPAGDEDQHAAEEPVANVYGRRPGRYGEAEEYGPDPMTPQDGWAPHSVEERGRW